MAMVLSLIFFRFSSITINLGPTFLSGALAANSESYLNKPSCPLIQVQWCPVVVSKDK